MKLSVKLLNSDARLNDFYELKQLVIGKGDTAKLVIRLEDAEKQLRYIPAVGAQVQLTISRFPEYFATVAGTRETRDFTVQGNMQAPFSEDRSIWSFDLTIDQTQNIATSGIRVTLTESGQVKNAIVPFAIQAFNDGQ